MPTPPTNYTDVQGPFSALQTFTRQTLPAPTDVVAIYDVTSRQLVVSFTAVTGTVTSYQLNVNDATGKTVLPGNSGTSPITVDASTLAIGTTYTILVRATATGVNGAWSAPLSLVPANLTAPTISTVTNESNSVVVAFSTVPGANSYTATVVDSQGKPLTPNITAIGASSPISIPAASLATGTSYQVKIRADVLNPPTGS